MNQSERDQLKRLVDQARRREVEKQGHLRQELNARSPREVKRQTTERKAIFAAQLAHDADLEQEAIVARRGGDVYLVSVGAGCARVLDLRGRAPALSAPEKIYALMSSGADWVPFSGDSDAIVAVAARLIDATP